MTDLRTAAQQALEAIEDSGCKADLMAAADALRAALAEPNDDYERGFIDGMKKQAQSSVDKAVNGLALPTCKDHLQDEPVAWVSSTVAHGLRRGDKWCQGRVPAYDSKRKATFQPLYFHPAPQRQPLTDAQLLHVYSKLPNWGMDMDSLPQGLKQFARAIEQAHGIGGKE